MLTSHGDRIFVISISFVCRYPAVFVIPAKVSDDMVMKIAKNYRANRLPVAVWRHRRSKGTLLRCGGLTKGMVAAAIKAGTEGTQNHRMSIANSSLDERFYSELGMFFIYYGYIKAPFTPFHF